MTTLLLAVLGASLVGSLHCVGMCGGIVALCTGGLDAEDRSVGQLAAWNLGRLVTYSGLGAASGAIGRAVDFGGGSVGLPRLAAIVAGAMMIGMGLIALARAAGVGIACPSAPAPVRNVIGRGVKSAMSLSPTRRSATIGLLTGFLPCGWLYAFVAASATTGDPLSGALVMTAFWLGTVPAMVGVGLGVRFAGARLRRHLPTLTAALLVIVGLVAVTGRLRVPAYQETVDARFTTVAFDENPVAAVDAASELPACCAVDAEPPTPDEAVTENTERDTDERG